MDEYAEIYWLDDDERNASRDHRTQGGRPTVWRPSSGNRVVRPARPPQRVIAQPMGQPMVAQPMVAQPMAVQQTYLGGLVIGQIIDMAAQALAALQPLPAAPVTTTEVSKDVGNLVLYQAALAQHAKRDEQLRTLGSLLGKLLVK